MPRFLTRTWLARLAAIYAGFIGLLLMTPRSVASRSGPEVRSPAAFEQTVPGPGAEVSPVSVRERVLATVVGIRVRLPIPQLKFTGKRKVVAEVSFSEGTGSGIVVDSSGLILTCAHVVGGAGKVRVFLADDREVEGAVVVYDPTSDLALVKVEAGPLPALDLRTGEAVREGAPLFLATRPGGATVRFLDGAVTAPGVFHVGHSHLEFFRRFEASIVPGDSGGALVAGDGRLVGIISVGLPGGNTGYAISSEFLLAALARLRAGPPVVWPWIGLAVEGHLDSAGAMVWSVVSGSPAQAAGVRPGDRIVTIDGAPIDHFLTAMLRILARPIGSRFELGIARGAGGRAQASSSPPSSAGGLTMVHPDQPADGAGPPPLVETVTVQSGPRAIEPVLDPLAVFERETGIRLEVVPPLAGRAGYLRAALVPPPKMGATGPCHVGSRLVGIVPGLNLVLALEEGRTDQEIRTSSVRELAEALKAASVGDRVAAALIWELDGKKRTMFLSGEAKRYAIL